MRNKIYLLALLLVLMHLPTLAQIGGGYDPSNPGDPGTPVLKYILTLKAIPTDGGSFSVTSTKVYVGENYNIRAYPNTDFVFVAWICDGDTISKSASYNITMPDHDVEIIGVFKYNPSNPADPYEQALKYQLSLRAEPMNSGSFNINNERFAVGSVNTLRAYTNTDFVFKHWRIGDSILSTNQNMDFTMPAHNVEIIGQFEYDPANPANPNANYWNPLTSEVIVDDFQPGMLSNAISTLLNRYGANKNDVQSIVVAGQMTSNDFGIANTYSNCAILDLSRVTGIYEIPSYSFDYTNLESVYLPATIEKIGNSAFYQCTKLYSLTVYAMTPPELGSYVFSGVPEGLVVYVPAAALTLYQDDPNWNNFILLPIQDGIRSLTVNLPSSANPADFTHMWLELTNTKNGQRMHLVMTDKMSYKFNNIICNTSWDVVLRNPNGDIFGQIESVEVGDEDVSVTFTSLSKPYSVSLSVLTPSGQDVTSQAEITWTDADGNYITQEPSIAGLPLGYQLIYSVKLPQELAMAYTGPSDTQYTVKNGNNAIVCHLTAISNVTVSGKVKDGNTGLPLKGANVTASQTFGGKYDKTISATTDNLGEFTFEIAKVPTVFGASATDYINKSLAFDVMAATGNIVLPDLSLDPITGATISIGFTYTPCHTLDVDADPQNWYSDYNNVDYTIFNKTKNRSIDQFSAQFPQIVLLEDVNDGDVLELTATSRKDAFKPVKATVSIAEQKANATFNIIELGKIAASFKNNSNPTVVGTLYDGNGKLVGTYNYSNAALEIDNLSDGNYTLITMGSSQFFNTIYDLTSLPQTGLISGVDYVRTAVQVQSGIISKVEINNVPLLDESKLYYTGENTSFTVNKPSIVIGNYLTLTGHLDFKPVYAGQVSNVSMIVDLPESCSFVENSVMVGNSTSVYYVDDNRITIPMTRYTDRVRFCVIPIVGGNYAPSAIAQFDIDGKTIKQPIGSVNYNAQELSINVPTTVAETTISVSGTAIGQCSVDIYDNDILIGQTTSLANGTWSTTVDLNEPYNLSVHNIYAKVTTKQGLELNTELISCTYDRYNIEAKTVTMLYDNPEMGLYTIVFDFINGTVSPSSYYFFPYKSWPNWVGSGTEPKEFTFVADLTNNDTTIVQDVRIKVFTSERNWKTLQASYDSDIDKWVASAKFEESNSPVGVKVKIISSQAACLDTEHIRELNLENDDMVCQYHQERDRISSLTDQIETELSHLSPDSNDDIIYQLISQFGVDLCEGHITDYLSNLDYDGLCTYVDNLCASIDTETTELESVFDKTFDEYGNHNEFSIDIDNFNATITYSIPYNTDINALLSEGFSVLPTTHGTILEKWEDDSYIRIDIDSNLQLTIKFVFDGQNILLGKPWDSIKALVQNTSNTLYDLANKLILTKEKIGAFIANMILEHNNLFAQLMTEDQAIADALKAVEQELKTATGFHKHVLNEKRIELLAKRAAMTAKVAEWTERHKFLTGFANGATKVLGLFLNIANIIRQTAGAFNKVNSLDVPQCLYEKDRQAAIELEYDILDLWQWVYQWHCWSLSRFGIYSLADMALSETVVLSCICIVAEGIGEYFYAQRKLSEFNRKYNYLVNKINRYKQKCDDDDDDDDDDDEPHPKVNPMHDPSGFVYEGVPSNRLQGVTATCFYKETVEDMYGDLHDEVVLWDAEQYGQENPLFTDENGFYRWDVPIGMWQVKYEKEGYETTYSDWLPVPPPQLDVNIGMVQMRQPEVIKARAYPKAVEFEFDKYMKPETLTTDNISVTANGVAVNGTVQLLNEEQSYEGEETFASRVRFNATNPFNADEVTLHVCHKVENYAGLRMSDDFEQTLTVEYEIEKIDVDTTIYVQYGDSRQITVVVEPAMAAKGKALTLRSTSQMIISTDAETYTLDKNGKTIITVNGNLPGTASLLFGVEGYDLTATTFVHVMMEDKMNVATPTASVASGSEVPKGTAVYLRCATEGATIYYTLDGSCPCDDTPTRKVYDGTPIIINGNITIKAMATAPDLYDSDVATFVYSVSSEINGDVNRDGEVNIADINVVIDVILRSNVNPDVLARADVNGDGEANIADINVIINIILSAKSLMAHEVNCDDNVHLDNVTLKPGEVRTMQVTLDNASHYSAMQCDIVLPAGLTLVGTNAIGSNVSKIGSIDEMSSRALTYSTNKTPFVNNEQGVLALTVRADAALSSESEITLTNVVLADLENKAWHIADCSARVNNSSGINDLTAIADRVWVDGNALFIESRQEGTAQLAMINGIVRDISLKHGINQLQLERGIYIVVINGNSHKIAIK